MSSLFRKPDTASSSSLSTDNTFLLSLLLHPKRNKNKRMVLSVDRDDEDAVSGFLKSEDIKGDDILIGFQVGASTVSRMWFAERFVELGKRLIAAHPATKIVITGSPDEKKYCEQVDREIGGRVIVSAGKLPLRQIPAR